MYLVLLILSIIFPSSAFAHSFFNDGRFMTGVLHPSLLENILIIVSVGVVCYLSKNKHYILLPLFFLLFMGVGGMISHYNFYIPKLDYGLALSLIILGLIIASNIKIGTYLNIFILAMIGILEGYGQIERNPDLNPAFLVGLASSVLVLVLLGFALCLTLDQFRAKGKMTLRIIGAILAGIGIQMLLTL